MTSVIFSLAHLFRLILNPSPVLHMTWRSAFWPIKAEDEA